MTSFNSGPCHRLQADPSSSLDTSSECILEAVTTITHIAISSDNSHFSRRTTSVGGTGAVAALFASTPALMTQRCLPGLRYALMPTCHSRQGTWAHPAREWEASLEGVVEDCRAVLLSTIGLEVLVRSRVNGLSLDLRFGRKSNVNSGVVGVVAGDLMDSN